MSILAGATLVTGHFWNIRATRRLQLRGRPDAQSDQLALS